jgi:hypothetical protein
MKGALVPAYQQMARNSGGLSFQGLSILQHAELLGDLIYGHKAWSLLDYGCGQGAAWREPHSLHDKLGTLAPVLYDPAFPEHDKLPAPGTKFDGVLCSDVLEHIPENELQAFIANLFSYSKGFVWASVCCRPAKKLFANGQNMHVTIRPMTWWNLQFATHAPTIGVTYYLTETP